MSLKKLWIKSCNYKKQELSSTYIQCGKEKNLRQKSKSKYFKKQYLRLKRLIHKIDRKHGYDEYNPPVEHGLYSIILVVEDCAYDESSLIALDSAFLSINTLNTLPI